MHTQHLSPDIASSKHSKSLAPHMTCQPKSILYPSLYTFYLFFIQYLLSKTIFWPHNLPFIFFRYTCALHHWRLCVLLSPLAGQRSHSAFSSSELFPSLTFSESKPEHQNSPFTSSSSKCLCLCLSLGSLLIYHPFLYQSMSKWAPVLFIHSFISGT